MEDMKNKLLDGAVIIAFLTALGYTASYLYQYSYLTYFGLPATLVSVNSGLIILIAVSCLVVSYLLFGLLHIFSILGILEKSEDERKRRKIYVVMFVVGTAELFIYQNKLVLIYFLVIIGLILIIELVSRHIKPKETDKQKELLLQEKQKEMNSRDLYVKLFQFLGPKFVVIFLFFIAVCIYASQLGYSTAENQRTFLVLSGDPSAVLIGMHNDSLIMMSFESGLSNDLSDINLTGEVFFRKEDESSGVMKLEIFRTVSVPVIRCGNEKSVSLVQC